MSGGLNVLNSWQLDETGKVNFWALHGRLERVCHHYASVV